MVLLKRRGNDENCGCSAFWPPKMAILGGCWLTLVCILSTGPSSAEALMLVPIYPADLAEQRFHPAVAEMDDDAGDDDFALEEAAHSMQKRVNMDAANGARLHRLIGALFSPSFHRRRTRGIQHLIDQRPSRRGGWRSAFHRTGGTILLGKRRAGRDNAMWHRDLPPLRMRRGTVEGAVGKSEESPEEEWEWPSEEEMRLIAQQRPIPGLLYGR